MSRIIRIERPDKLKLKFVTLDILIDNIILGRIKNNSTLEINIDENSHFIGLAMRKEHFPSIRIEPGPDGVIFSITIKYRSPINIVEPILFPMLEQKAVIPARVMINRQCLTIDEKFKDFISFRSDLVAFMIKVFNDQGIIDRMRLPNNKNHHIYVVIHCDGISIEYEPETTQGIVQWATGRVLEKIYYSQIGLKLPSVLPEYWAESLWEEIKTGILLSNSEIACNSMGAFYRNEIHPLF